MQSSCQMVYIGIKLWVLYLALKLALDSIRVSWPWSNCMVSRVQASALRVLRRPCPRPWPFIGFWSWLQHTGRYRYRYAAGKVLTSISIFRYRCWIVLSRYYPLKYSLLRSSIGVQEVQELQWRSCWRHASCSNITISSNISNNVLCSTRNVSEVKYRCS